MNFLLVEPEFPIPSKSKNHKDFLPIGLLKIATWLEKEGHKVQLVRGNIGRSEIKGKPKEIWITSLFTYWIEYVQKSVQHYSKLYPKAKIIVGGIAASLFGEEKTANLTGCHEVRKGVIQEAENVETELLKKTYDKFVSEVDFQILHAQRGCFRKCKFCGTWIIEPELINEETIKEKIFKRKLVFYDNNFLYNKNIETILDELIELKKKREILWCESQSGFDGRLLVRKPQLAKKLKKAGFRKVRIAWDWGYDEVEKIKEQIDILVEAGYKPKQLFMFVLYNWDIVFDEMEKKRVKCFEWGIQIADCRYRPLYQEYDYYKPRKKEQTNSEYYIHSKSGWSDFLIKQFRRNIRQQNICIRHNFDFYSSLLERNPRFMNIGKKLKDSKNKQEKKKILISNKIDYWDPAIPMKSEKIKEKSEKKNR